MIDYTKINREIQKINILYKYSKGACISIISTDNIEIKKYIKKSILSIDIDTMPDKKIIAYDFYENRDNIQSKY